MDEWNAKLNYLATSELPQMVSRGMIPEDLREKIGIIDNVTKLATALRRSRQSLYTPTKRLLADVRYLYRIHDGGDCRAEFEDGSRNDFVDEYRALHDGFADDDVTPLPEPRLFTMSLRLVIVDDPPPIMESLGSVEVVATQQFLEGQDGTLSGTLICRAANLEDVRIAVRFCKLRLLRSPDRMTADRGIRRMPIAPVQNDRKVEVTIQRVGTSQRPTVEIAAATGAIEMVSLPDDLWFVADAKAGDRFEAQLIVYLRDCTLVAEGDDAKPIGNEIRPEDGNSFIRPGYDRLGKALPLIQKRYEELRLSDGERDWAMLHRYVVQLVAANAAPAPGDGYDET